MATGSGPAPNAVIDDMDGVTGAGSAGPGAPPAGPPAGQPQGGNRQRNRNRPPHVDPNPHNPAPVPPAQNQPQPQGTPNVAQNRNPPAPPDNPPPPPASRTVEQVVVQHLSDVSAASTEATRRMLHNAGLQTPVAVASTANTQTGGNMAGGHDSHSSGSNSDILKLILVGAVIAGVFFMLYNPPAIFKSTADSDRRSGGNSQGGAQQQNSQRLPGPNVRSNPGVHTVPGDHVVRYTGRSCRRSDGSTGAQGYSPDGAIVCYRF